MADPGNPAPPVQLDRVRIELAAQGHPWVMGENSVTILEEDQRRHRLGVPLPPEHDRQQLEAQAKSLAAGEAARPARCPVPVRPRSSTAATRAAPITSHR